MPRRRTQSRSQTRSVLLGVVVVVLLIGAMGLISVLSSNGVVETQLGDREAGPYSTEDLADQITDDGPFLLSDASGRQQLDIYIQHLGDDPDEGWVAFLARSPGEDNRACTLKWQETSFRDPCSGKTFPADGTGLEQFTTRVKDGDLYVDFGAGTSG